MNLIGLGMVMGLAFAAPPGIVLAETLRRGISRGFPAALSVQMGSLIGDATYCLLALAGAAMLAQNPNTQRVLGILSVMLLFYLSVTGIRNELVTQAQPQNQMIALSANKRGAFVTGMFLSLTNPWAIGFWLSLGGALATFGAMESGGAMSLFFLSFFGVCLGYAFLIALLVAATRRVIPAKVARVISIACSAMIGVFGIVLALQLI